MSLALTLPALALGRARLQGADVAAATSGTLRLTVRDAQARPVAAALRLAPDAGAPRLQALSAEQAAGYTLALAPGHYRLDLTRQGFTPWRSELVIRAGATTTLQVTLQVATAGTQVEVNASAAAGGALGPAVVDSARANAQTLSEAPATALARGISQAVVQQPGWLMEANGVLHPRESEYDTQFILDGFPDYENRSPAWAPSLNDADAQAVESLTAGIPAEYGRKLGGVVAVTTRRSIQPGWHGEVDGGVGSAATRHAALALEAGWGADALDFSLWGGATDRYLDPAVVANFTNRASLAGGSLGWEHTGRTNFLRLELQHAATGFGVPDELVQQRAGQRQDRRNQEWSGSLSFERTLGETGLVNLRTRLRRSEDRLWSNPLSTPVLASERRTDGESYSAASLAETRGAQQFQIGADLLRAEHNERFADVITDPAAFDPGVPTQFQFAGRRPSTATAAYAQDVVRHGHWLVSAGLRWDLYRFLVRDHAWSPRLAAAWVWPAGHTRIFSAYDRVFQTPPEANLLLSSSPEAQQLTHDSLGLPVPASRGDYGQIGIEQGLGGWASVKVTEFVRNLRNFYDDDTLLNTGVSFPIAFAAAHITGTELVVHLRVAGWMLNANATNQRGDARLPVTGGLFLDPGAAALLTATGHFVVSQDQRNTAYAELRRDLGRGFWVATATHYGSGLPVDSGVDAATLLPDYGAAVLARVDFARGRVRPSFAQDLSAGWSHSLRDRRSLEVVAAVTNLSDRLNVINFASLFSGTAIGPPRQAEVHLRWRF